MTETRNALLEHFYQQQLQHNPDFCSLVDSGDNSHENAFKRFAQLCLENVEWKMTKFATLYSSSQSKGENSVEELMAHSIYTENYSLQCFKDRLSVLSVTGDSTDSDSVPVGVHRLALRACHLDLVNNLDLHGTTLLDELVGNHSIDESDALSIVARTEKRSRTEVFLRRLPVIFSAQTFMDSFIPVLSKYNPNAVSKLLSVIHQTSGLADFSKCTICQLKSVVEPRLLADVMYQHGIIDLNLHQDLREQNISNQEKWDRLTADVKDSRDILEAVRLRLPNLYKELDLATAESLDCWCHIIITQPALPTSGCDSSASAVSDIANVSDLSESSDDEDTGSVMSLHEESDEEHNIQTRCEKGRSKSSRIRHIFKVNIWNANQELTQSAGDTPEVDSVKGQTGDVITELSQTRGIKELNNSKCDMRSSTENIVSEAQGKQEVIYSREDSEEVTRPKKSTKQELLSHREDNKKVTRPPKRGFGVSVKSFLKRQLYSMRLLSSGHQRQAPKDDYFKYDAFLMYAHDVGDFVFHQCIFRLEIETGLRLCIGERDFLPGGFISESIHNANQSSRKTVVLLSPSFLESGWCTFEYEMALYEALERQQKGPLIVIYQDVRTADLPISMTWLLRKEPHLDYATTGGDDKFWRDLVSAIKE